MLTLEVTIKPEHLAFIRRVHATLREGGSVLAVGNGTAFAVTRDADETDAEHAIGLAWAALENATVVLESCDCGRSHAALAAGLRGIGAQVELLISCTVPS